MTALSASPEVACVGCDVTFTATAEKCSCVNWSGGGDPATQEGGCTFTTHWDTPGTKTVTASNSNDGCSSSKQKQVTIVKVEIEYPYDTNSNDLIDDADNEFSFNADDPAILQINCIAVNSPGADPDKYRWTIQDIGSIRGEWNPHVDNDPYTGKGASSEVIFTGLPANNSDFGVKTITLEYLGLSCTDSEDIEVFFDPLAINNDGPEPDDIPSTIDLREVVIRWGN